jgi:hypothetical protein
MSRRSSVYVSRNFNHYIIVQCSDGFHWLSLDYIRSFSNLLEEAANFLTVKAVLCLSTIHIYLIVYRFVHVLFFSPSRNLEAYTFLLDGFPMFLSRKSPVDGGFSAATGSTGPAQEGTSRELRPTATPTAPAFGREVSERQNLEAAEDYKVSRYNMSVGTFQKYPKMIEVR